MGLIKVWAYSYIIKLQRRPDKDPGINFLSLVILSIQYRKAESQTDIAILAQHFVFMNFHYSFLYTHAISACQLWFTQASTFFQFHVISVSSFTVCSSSSYSNQQSMPFFNFIPTLTFTASPIREAVREHNSADVPQCSHLYYIYLTFMLLSAYPTLASI